MPSAFRTAPRAAAGFARPSRVIHCVLVAGLLVSASPAAIGHAEDPARSVAEPRAWPPPLDRVALLPPVEFNLEEGQFAGEPIADADPEPVPPRRTPRRGGGPFGSGAPVSIGGLWAPATAVFGQPATLGMNAQFARVAAPLVPPAEGAPLWLGIGRFGRLELATTAILPDSGLRVPDQLWLVETGFTHIRPQDSGGTLGGTFLFGSASDRPFAAGRDLTLMVIGFWNTPARNGRDEWNMSIFYSPTSQIPYPLPGLSYGWRPDDSLEAKLGVPASIEWRPDDAWTISAAYFPLTNVNAEARRRLGADWSAVAFYRTDTQIYFLADRRLDAERLYVFDQRAAVGLERTLGAGFTIEALASWLFDRTIFQGTSFTSGRTDLVAFAPGPGISLQLLWRR